MATRPRVLSLCAGIGGIDLGLRAACGARTVGCVERDAYAASVLVARMADAALDPATVWDDLSTFDGRPWRGRVDLVAAGIPCQPFSVAGKRRGLEDARWLWSDVLRILDETAARTLFLENVGGFVRHGLGRVLTDLAARGFVAEWDHFRASDVGAPHRRERFFLLADASDGLFSITRRQPEERNGPGSAGAPLADADAALRDESGWSRGASRARPTVARDAGEVVADANGDRRARRRLAERTGLEGTRGSVADGCGDDGRLGWPPARNDADGWREWIAAGGPEPAVRRGSDGLPSRVDRLRCLGNAVVPAQAELAFHVLAARLMEGA